MTRRLVVNVATSSWIKGQDRLIAALADFGDQHLSWRDVLPRGCPSHDAVPYAFKAYAMKEAAAHADLILWADASIVPVRPLDPVWETIERQGYWIAKNGWDNSDWTADNAYADLFPGVPLEEARELNRKIPHVVATTFGLDVRSDVGQKILAEYFRLASTTRAFCGPWQNTSAPNVPKRNVGRHVAECGPPSTLGHRHDQTALSVIAHRAGCVLEEPPGFFAYESPNLGEKTVLLARGI